MSERREGEVTAAFVSLASSLANGFDVIDLLNGLTSDCARLLNVESAGLLLADSAGVLHVMAASSERTRILEVFQLQRAEGPCLDCYHEGSAVSIADLTAMEHRWPQFVPAARSAGFASVHALPMRLRDARLGTLGLFGSVVGELGEADLNLAQALADVASVALVQDRAVTDSDLLSAQLQTALTSRVALEQAKGVLAQLGGLDMADAFAVLRGYSRDHNLKLTEVAKGVIGRELPARMLLDHAAARQSK